jgi:hypothetical protein
VLGLQLVRDAGALTMLPLALSAYICAQIYAGELAAAEASIEDQKIATEATGSQLARSGRASIVIARVASSSGGRTRCRPAVSGQRSDMSREGRPRSARWQRVVVRSGVRVSTHVSGAPRSYRCRDARAAG